MGIIKPIVITLISLFILSLVLPGVSYLNFPTLIIASIVLTILQKFIRPVLSILFLPINIITLGLFSWIINVLILWMAIALVPGFHIDQVTILGIQLNWIFSLVVVSLIISIIESLIELIF